MVSIEDDGRGMDRAAIRAKAVAQQIIAPDANLSDKEALNLILLPGFSTARSVTSVSGRGVGMDVVKRQIDALRGSLSLTSEPGKGTCVSLTLPLTLAIIEGLLVEAGRESIHHSDGRGNRKRRASAKGTHRATTAATWSRFAGN